MLKCCDVDFKSFLIILNYYTGLGSPRKPEWEKLAFQLKGCEFYFATF